MFKIEGISTVESKPVSGYSFREDFISFLNAYNFSFVELQKNRFYFEGHNLFIQLVGLEESSQKSIGTDTIYLYEDRWFSNKGLVQKRVLSRLGVFKSVFARKCRIISDSQVKADSRLNKRISDFLNEYHSYGDAKCRYRYALEYEGQMVAVATFSAPRPMPRQISAATQAGEVSAVIFDSYEWVRYASLPDIRVVGGMGRLFKAFLEDLECNKQCRVVSDVKIGLPGQGMRPFEVMTYSDTEWSSGDVYEKLGFRLVQERKPVEFYVHRDTFERVAINKVSPHFECGDTYVKIRNKGSRKYLYNCSPIDWSSLA